YGASDMGMTSHRGVLHPDEYVDEQQLRELVARALGFTFEQLEDAYRNGRPTADRARIRAQIDARLLALSRSGGNLTALARALGWEIEGNGTCRKIDRALERARLVEAA